MKTVPANSPSPLRLICFYYSWYFLCNNTKCNWCLPAEGENWNMLIILHLPSHKNTSTTGLNRGACLGNRTPKVPEATTSCSDSDLCLFLTLHRNFYLHQRQLFVHKQQPPDGWWLCFIFLVGVCTASTAHTVIPLSTEKKTNTNLKKIILMHQ